MIFRRSARNQQTRRAAVAVEFAIMAPMLLSIVVGLIEVNRAYDAQNLLQTAAREGARFASMDRTDMMQEGESTNAKLVNDVTNFLNSSGLPGDSIQVEILDATDPTQPFDLDNPDNDLGLFIVEISMMFSDVSYTPVSGAYDYQMTADIVFRNGRATLSQ